MVNETPSTAQRQQSVALPYVQGTSEKLRRIFQQHGVPSYHKPFNTIKSLLVHPKDQSETHCKCNTVYSIVCDTCKKEYVGESGRTIGIRYGEHTDGKHSSAIYAHVSTTGHTCCSLENVKVISREDKYWARKYRESIQIHKRKPKLNRDQGLEIPPILLSLIPDNNSNLQLRRHPVARSDQDS